MQKQGKWFVGFSILLFSIASGCSLVDTRIIETEFSPSGMFKIIKVSAGAGTATSQIVNLYLLRKDVKLQRNAVPIFTAKYDNIINVDWLNEKEISVVLSSRRDIEFQVIYYYGFQIHYLP
jgi:hypothetical protein